MSVYLRILAGANMAYDTETGESCSAYAKLEGITFKDDLSENELNAVKKDIGKLIHVEPEHLEIISEDEYEEDVDED